MNINYLSPQRRGSLFRSFFLMLLVFLWGIKAHVNAQSTANYTFSTNTTGSLGLDMNGNTVDMSTGTTQVLASNTSQDQVINGTAISFPAGFDFFFGGTRFTSFFATSNGVVQLGNTAVIAGSTYTIAGGTLAAPRFSAFNGDLGTGTTGGIFGKLFGTGPNRCYVIEFRNMNLMWNTYTNDGTYQVRFYESTGVVEYVYGSMFCNTTVNAADSSPEVGFSWGSAANQSLSVNIGTSATDISGTIIQNTVTAGTNIVNLHSTAEGSRRAYRFTPTVPTAASGLSFASVAGSSMTLNWTDNATNELGYVVYRSTDGINYTFIAQLAANSATYNATGLSFGTTYYWKVSPVTEGALSVPVLTGNQTTVAGTLSGIKTVGLGGDYSNLTTAFNDINTQGLSGDVELQLISGYPAIAETYPILSSNTPSTGAFNIKVYPTVSGLSITSANTTGTLNLNNAKNLTFDGRVNQAGAIDLVISNTNLGASYAIQLVNDANNNTLKYLNIFSTNNSTTSGTVVFAGSTGTTGNDNNLIDNCDIRDGATTPTNGIYSAGTSAAVDNSGNSVTNSNVFNYFNSASNSNGIFLASNSSTWTINANRFYQSATRTVTAGSQHRAINVVTANGNGYVITNNVIGFANAAGTGLTTYNGGFAGRFFGIEVSSSNTGTASSIQGNTISGLSLSTTSGSTTAPGVFSGISVLGGSVSIGNITPNTVGASSGNGSISITTTTSANSFGIHANSTGTLNVSNNIVSSISTAGSTPAVVCGFVGINTTGASASTTISGNTIGSATAGSITANVNATTTGSSAVSGIAAAGSTTSLTVTGNVINNLINYANNAGSALNGIISINSPVTSVINSNTVSNLTLASGTLSNISNASPVTLTSSNNTIFNSTITGASGTIYGILAGTTQFTMNNNIIRDLSVTANSGATASGVFGIYDVSSPTIENATNNQIYNLSMAGASTSAGNLVTGIISNTTAGSTKNISGNSVYGLSFTNSSTGAAIVNGISSSLGTASIFKNKIYNISAGGAGSIANGIIIPSGTTVNVYNNVIGDLKAPTASAADAIRGIALTSTTTTSNIRVYYNSVYLNASSTGTNFGTSGIFHTASATATTAALDMRNNIIINESVPAGTGITVAYRRSGTALNNFAATSNRNMLYAGIASATNLLMYDGTTSYQAMVPYQTAVTPREVNSFTGEATFIGAGYGTAGNFFISTTPSNVDYLRPVAGITSQVESGGVNITTPSITDDYSSSIRQGNAGYVGTGIAPDLGAFEFAGTSPAPVITLNSVTPPATTQCTASARLVSVNITTPSGTILGATIGYTVNGVPQTNIVMNNVSGTTWEGTIPASTPVNATIAWGVAATNSIGVNSSYTGTPYSDEPLFGTTASASSSIATVCSGSPSILTASLVKTGTGTIGSGSTISTNAPGSNPFYGGYGGVKTQYIVRASELVAAGFAAGNITQLSMNITTVGSSLTGFAISAENTALTVLTGNIENVGTQVYSIATFVPTLGVNNFPFSTPLNWDGTSNIIISICWSNNNTSNTASQLLVSNTSFVSGNARYVDSRTAAEVCGYIGNTAPSGWNGASTSVSTRPIFVLTGNTPPPISAITWSDGVGTVGTTNPVTVNPTGTTTYTANITAFGCNVTPAPTTTVTVNPLPSAPTAVNSAQCGAQIPTASVTSTSGLPTPTFVWYSASSGGTIMQSSTSTTYTSNVVATTTFYVAEQNTVTGCESTRTPVTVNVSTPDAVSASIDNGTICIGSSVTLTAANLNPTPFQSYTYTWTGTAGSGVTTQVGTAITVTPTLPGTYTYNLSAVDGGCTAIASIGVTVNPFTVVITPINVTCNGYNNGSFSLGATTCGTSDVVSVDGGAFGSIPTNLTPGTHTVVVRNLAGFTSASQNITITEPSTVIPSPTGTNVAVCQNAIVANVAATSTTNAPGTGSVQATVNFNVTAQPAESFTAPGNIVASASLPVLPAGSVINSLVINYNGITPNATGEYQSDVRLGLTGAFTNANAAGVGTTGSGTVIGTPFNYTRTITSPVGFPLTGGTINLMYHNDFNDATTTVDALFATGNVASLVINYTPPASATISWWTASTGGTQIGTGSPLNAVGTSVLPNTSTPGTYTLYAQGDYTGCSSVNRTPVTVTVKPNSTNTITATACNTYTLNASTYTSSGTYTQILTNSLGCDSTITLNLTINPSTSSTVTASACGSYTWAQNGTTYTTSGSYPVVLAGANSNGCDSTVTLILTINQPTSSTVTATACGSYTWAQNGTTYTTSGSYPVVLAGANENGCDSTVTLNLTINQPTSSTVTVSACGSYTWAENSVTYTASGSYPVVLAGANANGCDSTVTLVLTINQPTSSTVTAVACGSYTWAENSVTYTTSGSYPVVLAGANANGCDSTVTLVLTINQPTSSTVTAVACDSYTWAENGTTYTTSGSYPVVLAGANSVGCDSTITLNLTINNSATGIDVQTACGTYTWIDGNTYTASNNTATFTIVGGAASGCDSIVTLNLTINAIPTATATDNGDATITASAGTSYQWVNCTTGLAVSGANAQTFAPSVNGSYAVVVTNASGCSDTSACVNINNVGVKEFSSEYISVYPNPTHNNVTITMTAAEANVVVVDGQGKTLKVATIKNGEQISLEEFATGVYFLNITTEFGTQLVKVSKN